MNSCSKVFDFMKNNINLMTIIRKYMTIVINYGIKMVRLVMTNTKEETR